MQAASSRRISELRFTIIESFDPRQSHIKSVSITLAHLARAAVNSQAISWYVNGTISTSCQHVYHNFTLLINIKLFNNWST